MNTIDSPNNTPVLQPIWNTVLRYGGYCGAAMVAFGIITYVLDVNMMTGTGMLIVYAAILGIAFAFAAISMKQQRSLDGGLISYGRAFLVGFLVLFLGIFVSGLWNYVLVNFIDPEYIYRMEEQFVDSWGESMPEDALEEARKGFREAGSIATALKNGVMGGAIIGLIISAITAAFMKREPQVKY